MLRPGHGICNRVCYVVHGLVTGYCSCYRANGTLGQERLSEATAVSHVLNYSCQHTKCMTRAWWKPTHVLPGCRTEPHNPTRSGSFR